MNDPSHVLALPAAPPPRKTRAELMKDIDAEYYGYRDEDDGVLVPLEQEYEKEGRLGFIFSLSSDPIHLSRLRDQL